MQGQDGKEIRIYRPDGRKIGRRGAKPIDIDRSCGIFVNLRTIGAVFQDPLELDMEDMDLDDDDDSPPPPKQDKVSLSVYPQAYLRDYGHIQAKGTLHIMHPVINTLNASLVNDANHSEAGSDEPDDLSDSQSPAVMAISTQMYNGSLHRAATQAGAQDVQRGKLTATLACGDPQTAKNKRTAESLKHYCEVKLPHMRYRDRINIDSCPCDLRVETVYVADMFQLPVGHRDGK